jgi:hypothetical protein
LVRLPLQQTETPLLLPLLLPMLLPMPPPQPMPMPLPMPLPMLPMPMPILCTSKQPNKALTLPWMDAFDCALYD